MVRTNKQGIKILDPIGVNGHKSQGSPPCRHFYHSGWVVIGKFLTRNEPDDLITEAYEIPLLGKKCMSCGEILETVK